MDIMDIDIITMNAAGKKFKEKVGPLITRIVYTKTSWCRFIPN